jgi:signal transduction histidine kinase
MNELILLHTHSILAFILALTQIGMLIYLFGLKEDTRIRRWMIINYIASVIWQVDQTIRFSIHPGVEKALLYKLETTLIYSPALAILTLSYFQILYLFIYQPYEKERKIMERIVIPIAIGLVAFNAWNEFANDSNLLVFQAASFVYGVLTNVWALVLSIRKARYLRPIDPKAARAHEILIGVNVMFIVMCVILLIFGLESPVGYWSFFVFIWLCNLGQIIVYITYSAVPASFQIKIAGFSYVTVVSILIVVTLVFFPPLDPLDILARMGQQKGLMQMFIMLGLAALVVSTVLPALLRQSLTDPVKRLLSGVQSVNSGDLDTQVPVGSMDEIGDLTENFNQMTQSLKRANIQLREYAETLEVKVADRTASLNQSLKDLRAAQAQLVQAEKMASLGELTAGIAHEIQNPLNFVNNFSEVSSELLNELKEELVAGNKQESLELVDDIVENLIRINHHGGRAADIVKSMLEHSKGIAGKKEATDINALCVSSVDVAFSAELNKNPNFKCDIIKDLDEHLHEIKVIKDDLARVLQNIFNNAFYAVNEKKRRLEDGDIEYIPKVNLTTRTWTHQQKNGIEISISDNATGMPDKVKSKIFQPFYTTKPTGQGSTGLGLSLSYDIVTKGHGGEFLVESIEGQGTTMIIRLPHTA